MMMQMIEVYASRRASQRGSRRPTSAGVDYDQILIPAEIQERSARLQKQKRFY